jgi:uncharacterized protein YciI
LEQFLLVAYDYKDEGALERRMSVREQHLTRAREMKREGKILFGGAILNKDSTMIGSSILYEAENEAQVREWIAQDPYVTGRVWEQISLVPFRLAKIE